MKKLFVTIAVALLAAASASAQVKIEVGGNYGGFSNNVNSQNPAASFLRSIKSGFLTLTVNFSDSRNCL